MYFWKIVRLMESTEITTLEKPASTGIDTGGNARVILYNDDWHTFQQVISQLILAIRCSAKKAEGLANKVHHEGKAEVYAGTVEECLQVSAVLEEIQLRTEVQFN
jgi:ATP-dependent Clp protease adaptor protein ClpS